MALWVVHRGSLRFRFLLLANFSKSSRSRRASTPQAAMALALAPFRAGCHRAEASARRPHRPLPVHAAPRPAARPPRQRARRAPVVASAASRSSPPPPPHLEDVLLGSGRTTDMAHALWRAVARKGDLAVDATAGNGWDTAVLAELVLGDDGEEPGAVLAFDVQPSALASTRRRVDERLDAEKASRVRLVLDSHATLEAHVGEYEGARRAADDEQIVAARDDARDDGSSSVASRGVGVACFNLGYLPGADSDKSVVTETTSTVRAVRAAIAALRPGGVLTVVGYVGHAGGAEETEAVAALVATLDPKTFTAATHAVVNRENCPRLIVVHRKETTVERNRT